MVKVMPKNDKIRNAMRHPTGLGFRDSGPTDWPDDTFTARRIRDGDVTVVEDKSDAKAK